MKIGVSKLSGSSSPAYFSREQRNRFLSRSTQSALIRFVPDMQAWIGFALLAVSPLPWRPRLAAAIFAGIMVGACFVVGHDAAHQSLTPHRTLNRWIARVALGPSAHGLSLWELSHNTIHHRFTSLLGSDHVWAPMTLDAYRNASAGRRWLYRLYRGPFGHLPYYMVDQWLKRNLFPLAPEHRDDRWRHLPDILFTLAFRALWIGAAIRAGTAFDPARPWVGPRTVMPIIKACKLFDTENGCWCDFSGRPTSPPLYDRLAPAGWVEGS